MSHQIFFQAHSAGNDQQIAVEAIIGCFHPFVVKRDAHFISLDFGNGNTSTIFIETTQEATSNFMVSQPCGDPRLDECIFRAASLGYFIAFEAGFEGAYVFSNETAAHLPNELKKDIPEFIFIASADEWINRQ